MILEYDGKQPSIHKDAYIAPNAVIRGDVTIAKGTSILYGAIITDEGGSVKIGENCVVMENAIVRGVPKHSVKIGHSVLVGPHSHLTGCTIDDEVFLATGSTVFNGAQIKTGSEVRIYGVVHINTTLEAGTIVPIGWIAVGDPVRILPPDQHSDIWKIQKDLDFPGTVWGTDRSTPQGQQIRSYAKALLRHKGDKIQPISDR